MNVPPGSPPALSKLAQAMLAALRAAPARSLAPADLARMLAAGDAAATGQPARAAAPDWRALLAPVRQTGLALARAGHVVVLRKGHPVPAEDARGVIRLALPERRAAPIAPDAAIPPSLPPSFS